MGREKGGRRSAGIFHESMEIVLNLATTRQEVGNARDESGARSARLSIVSGLGSRKSPVWRIEKPGKASIENGMHLKTQNLIEEGGNMTEFQNVMEVFKLLEKSNCGECDNATCLAFA